MEKKTMRRRYASFVALTAMLLSAVVPMTAFADDDGKEAEVVGEDDGSTDGDDGDELLMAANEPNFTSERDFDPSLFVASDDYSGGNVACEQVLPNNDDIESIEHDYDGSFDGSWPDWLTVTVDHGKEVGFTASDGYLVMAAIVKGSNASHVYDYSTEDGIASDGTLLPPLTGGPDGDRNIAGLSNLTFCFEEPTDLVVTKEIVGDIDAISQDIVLDVACTIDGGDGSETTVLDETITISASDISEARLYSETFPDLPDGATCSVTEVENGIDTEAPLGTVVTSVGSDVDIVADDEVEIAVINTYTQYDMNFAKFVCDSHDGIAANNGSDNLGSGGVDLTNGGIDDMDGTLALDNGWVSIGVESDQLPSGCAGASGWTFDLLDDGDEPVELADGSSSVTTGEDGLATVTLTGDALTAALNNDLWVRESFDRLEVSEDVKKANGETLQATDGDYTFSALRCGNDVQNNDNREQANLGAALDAERLLDCVAYNVGEPDVDAAIWKLWFDEDGELLTGDDLPNPEGTTLGIDVELNSDEENIVSPESYEQASFPAAWVFEYGLFLAEEAEPLNAWLGTVTIGAGDEVTGLEENPVPSGWETVACDELIPEPEEEPNSVDGMPENGVVSLAEYDRNPLDTLNVLCNQEVTTPTNGGNGGPPPGTVTVSVDKVWTVNDDEVPAPQVPTFTVEVDGDEETLTAGAGTADFGGLTSGTDYEVSISEDLTPEGLEDLADGFAQDYFDSFTEEELTDLGDPTVDNVDCGFENTVLNFGDDDQVYDPAAPPSVTATGSIDFAATNAYTCSLTGVLEAEAEVDPEEVTEEEEEQVLDERVELPEQTPDVARTAVEGEMPDTGASALLLTLMGLLGIGAGSGILARQRKRE